MITYRSIYHANVNVILMEENLVQINCGTTININAGAKKFLICEKDSIWNTIICGCKNGNYLATYDQETKTIPTNFNEKRATL